MTLADTSAWIDHLRHGNPRLSQLLRDGDVLSHPFVVGELACGSLMKRTEILGLLTTLPKAVMAEHAEVLRLIDEKRLHGRGLGWVDMHLLASAVLSRSSLWSLDRALARAAATLGIGA